MTTPTPPSNTPVVPKTDREIADEASKRVVKLYNLSQALGDNYENHPIGDDEFQIEQLTPFFLEAIAQAKAGLVEELDRQKNNYVKLYEAVMGDGCITSECHDPVDVATKLRAQLAEVTKERDAMKDGLKWASREAKGALPKWFHDLIVDAKHCELSVCLEQCNRYGEIIESMSEILGPEIGEHNIDCAKRVASERNTLKQSLSTSEAQNAEMREALEEIRNQAMICGTTENHVNSNWIIERSKEALSSSAGRDYVKRAELDKANALLRECQLHLGNALDEVITTRRDDWPRDLLCVVCSCNVTKGQEHSKSCKLGPAYVFWDELSAHLQGASK